MVQKSMLWHAQSAGDVFAGVNLPPAAVTRYYMVVVAPEEAEVPAPAERMRTMRERRRARGLRELRLVVPDPRLQSVRQRVASQVARLDRRNEDEALNWIEAASEFDAPDTQGNDETR